MSQNQESRGFSAWQEIVEEIRTALSIKSLLIASLTGNIGDFVDTAIAVGKSAGLMMKTALEAGLSVQRGLVISPSLNPFFRNHPAVVQMVGNHPLPSTDSRRATHHLIRFLAESGRAERTVVFMSGGSSALVSKPIRGLPFATKTACHRALINSGNAITTINTVRRHLSSVKGGGLLRLLQKKQAFVQVFAVSDVPGDAPHDIGSGLFAPDPTTFSQARHIAQTIPGFPESGLQALLEGVAGRRRETLKPAEVDSSWFHFRVIAGNQHMQTTILNILRTNFPSHPIQAQTLSGTPESWVNHLAREVPSVFSGHPGIVAAFGETEVAIYPESPIGKGGRITHLTAHLGLKLWESQVAAEIIGLATDGNDGGSGCSAVFFRTTAITHPEAEEIKRLLSGFDTAGFFVSRHWAQPCFDSGLNFGDMLLLRIIGPAGQ
jgi:glycerate-2-kinase